jgi:hypothetical protein
LLATYPSLPPVPSPPRPVSPKAELVSTTAPPRFCSIISGAAAWTVFQTPTRLTSSWSRKACRGSAEASMIPIPALASTTSIPPSSRAPSVIALATASASRTSTSVVTARRPCSATRRAVSFRSAGVARS